ERAAFMRGVIPDNFQRAGCGENRRTAHTQECACQEAESKIHGSIIVHIYPAVISRSKHDGFGLFTSYKSAGDDSLNAQGEAIDDRQRCKKVGVYTKHSFCECASAFLCYLQ